MHATISNSAGEAAPLRETHNVVRLVSALRASGTAPTMSIPPSTLHKRELGERCGRLVEKGVCVHAGDDARQVADETGQATRVRLGAIGRVAAAPSAQQTAQETAQHCARKTRINTGKGRKLNYPQIKTETLLLVE